VGDLPPQGFTSSDLRSMFAAYGWRVADARVMAGKCFGFVEFASPEEAEHALQLVQDRDPGFAVAGQPIRASWARGSLPTWKTPGPRDGMGAPLEAYGAPAMQFVPLPAVMAHGGAPVWVAAAAGLPLVAPQAALIDYGDL
jgi:hypothetical protein